VEPISTQQATGRAAGKTEKVSGTAEAGPGEGKPAKVCPHFHAAVELVGKRWSGAILWSLSERPHYFAELAEAIPGVSDRLLSRRLRELEAEGLVERSVHPGAPLRVSYSLSDKGRALQPAIREISDWAQRWKHA
jgi:DNA-binding HxlR family transcriptional regulator